MPEVQDLPSIPMLGSYSRQFEASERHAVKGRKGRIFMEICKPKKVTRKELAKNFNIRPGTVSNLVLELIEHGLVQEGRPTTPYQKGRPEIILRPVMSSLGVIVFYVVSQSIHATLLDFGGNELCNESKEVHADQIENDDLKDLIIGMAENLRARAPVNTNIVGISFSVPGIVDEANNSWVFATSRWPQIRNMDFSQIGDALNLNVTVNKNLNCEVQARIARRGEKSTTNILFIHWGHGIGATYSLGKTSLISGNGGVGEIGHTYTHCKHETQCRCGLKNCLETQAALWALLPELRKIYPEIPTDEWSFESFLKNNEKFDISILDNAVHLMAVAMRNLTMILSPHQIVLTGPFVQHSKIFEQLSAEFRLLLPSQSHVFAHSNVMLTVARAGTEDEIIGAAYPQFERTLLDLCS